MKWVREEAQKKRAELNSHHVDELGLKRWSRTVKSAVSFTIAEDRRNSNYYKNVLHLTWVNCLDSLNKTAFCVYVCATDEEPSWEKLMFSL